MTVNIFVQLLKADSSTRWKDVVGSNILSCCNIYVTTIRDLTIRSNRTQAANQAEYSTLWKDSMGDNITACGNIYTTATGGDVAIRSNSASMTT